MKTILIISILLVLALMPRCEKCADCEGLEYEAEVIGCGLDCGNLYLISIDSRRQNADFVPGIYYANNLPEAYKQNGLKIQVNCRQPKNDELPACTMLGISYPHVYVISAQKAE